MAAFYGIVGYILFGFFGLVFDFMGQNPLL